MRIIDIMKGASYQNLDEIKRLTEGMKIRRIKIHYNPNIGLPREDEPTKWPVKMIFDNGHEKVGVRVWAYTVGYGGSGPTDFEQLLKYYNIDYNERDIFSKCQQKEDGYITLSYIA